MQYILSFVAAVSTEVENIDEVSGYKLSKICSTYYKTVKNSTTSEITEKFLKFQLIIQLLSISQHAHVIKIMNSYFLIWMCKSWILL